MDSGRIMLPLHPTNKSETELLNSTSTSPRVQISGYLKKKRNRVGGWRKMWFVLHNQLLVSYSSKENYDKKLVSFKDAVNLVPGTVVKPFGAFRFTIEMPSNVLYTFRCDDKESCAQWIQALVDSLKMNKLSKKPSFMQKYQNISLENIRSNSNPLHQSMRIRSCDSINQSISNRSRSPRIPISNFTATAKILERNGISTSSDLQIKVKETAPTATTTTTTERVKNFRLHQEKPFPTNEVDQSYQIFRINEMFNRKKDSGVGSGSGSGSGSSSSSFRLNQSKHPNNDGKSGFNLLTGSDLIYRGGMNMDYEKKRTTNCSAIEEEVKRLSLKESINNKTTSHSRESTLIVTTATCSTDSPSTSSSASTTSSSSSSHDEKGRCRGSTGSTSSGCSCSLKEMKIYSTISSDEEDVVENVKDNDFGRSHVDDEEDDEYDEGVENDGKNEEPIYAVVDLKNKYERRKLRKELEDTRKEQAIQLHSSDYEEVLNFSSDGLDLEDDDDPDDCENIYEPIHVPEMPNKRNFMWKFVPRAKIDAFLEMTKARRKTSMTSTSDGESSPFSDIRMRFGKHRKSLKNRMRKFYYRNNLKKDRNAFSDDEESISKTSPPSPISSASTATSENSLKPKVGKRHRKSFVLNEIEKYRLGEKHLFGNLTILKTSPKKKVEQGSVNANFQAELTREVSRRSQSGRVVGDSQSKFYD
ncbi:hypothetical protein ACFFRR_004207 [Megaselia abdita]